MTSEGRRHTAPPLLRFVVLRHSGVAEPHFDLMLELAADSLLATWRCAHWPPAPGEIFERLADHRRIYLEYEGPISGGRGTVNRAAMGSLRIIQNLPDVCEFTMDSAAGSLRVRLTHAQRDQWTASLSDA